MPYIVPSFPLAVKVFTGPLATRVFRFNTTGNLAPGKRVFVQWWDWRTTGQPPLFLTLLVPAGTDLRGWNDPAAADIVEVPAGTGRLYVVEVVDDFGRGFPNEHRFAYLSQTSPWPQPIP